jgi:hypothetical protein
MDRVTPLEEEAAEPGPLDLVQVVQVEETEALVHLLALLVQLLFTQVAVAVAGTLEAQDPEEQADLEAGGTVDLMVAQRRGHQILVVGLAVMDFQVEVAQMEVLVL